jgi:endoglucanase
VKPVTGLVIDMDHATDLPPLDETQHGTLRLGEGPTIARGANINPVVFGLLTEAAARRASRTRSASSRP